MGSMPEEFTEDEWKIVKLRVLSMPANMKIFIGGSSFKKDELIQHVEDRDDVGKLLVKIHLNYLRSFKKEAEMLSV